jgi:predicted ATP-dependent endonuclease of OLD family
MLFRQIQVRNFRKLVSPLVIKGLGEGLTVIVGDNEEGKKYLACGHPRGPVRTT